LVALARSPPRAAKAFNSPSVFLRGGRRRGFFGSAFAIGFDFFPSRALDLIGDRAVSGVSSRAAFLDCLGDGLSFFGGCWPFFLRDGVSLFGGGLPVLGGDVPFLGEGGPFLGGGLPVLSGDVPFLGEGGPFLSGFFPRAGLRSGPVKVKRRPSGPTHLHRVGGEAISLGHHNSRCVLWADRQQSKKFTARVRVGCVTLPVEIIAARDHGTRIHSRRWPLLARCGARSAPQCLEP
jgi:hypothetical protein